jgi:thioredoxin-related protein
MTPTMKTIRPIYILIVIVLCSCSDTLKKNAAEKTNADTKTAAVVEQPEDTTARLTDEPGTVFYDLNLAGALDKAKHDGKFVLVDCHTKTCNPCKKMEREIFPLEKCGKFINEHFVPIMVDIEEGDGPDIKSKYDVGIYPTYLVLMPNSDKKGEIVGAIFDPEEFIGTLSGIILIEK